MQDVLSRIAQMNRPRLLVRAARLGTRDYRRDVHLPRLLGTDSPPRSADALIRLSELEAELNERRLIDDAAYSVNHHIDLLIAMISEARLLKTAAKLRAVVT